MNIELMLFYCCMFVWQSTIKNNFTYAFCFCLYAHLFFKVHNRMNKHDAHHRTPKQARRHHRCSYQEQNSASSVTLNNKNNNCNDDVVSQTKKHEISRKSLPHPTDSDGETDTTMVKPWAPTSDHANGTLVPEPYNNNINDNNNPNSPSLTIALRALFEMITEDLDKFVYTPAPNGLGDIQCRITRDKRGMEKGLFPTYYMHVERPGDGKKVNQLN